jgi:ABC-type antimicrobial peptide transport system permease subunit
MKKSILVKGGSSNFRKVLVIVQFSLSIMLIICTGIIYSQLLYIQNKDLGFNNKDLIYIRSNTDIDKNFVLLKKEILQNPDVLNMTRTYQMPSYNLLSTRGEWEGKTEEQDVNFNVSIADFDYVKTFGINIIEGRNFSREFSTDTVNVILNEEAVKQMGLESPIGKTMTLWWGDAGSKIIGIAKNYHFMPLSEEIEPLALVLDPEMYEYIVIKINPEDYFNTIKEIQKIWNRNIPDSPFEYNFLDEDYERIYRRHSRTGNLLKYFTLLAIFISCLGLFGLASFITEQRTKEIGVRKTLGGSVTQIIALLSKEFVKWVVIAFVIASPLAWYFMRLWLQGFVYRTHILWWIFALAGILSLIIALLTVIYQAYKTANNNPIESLRYE